MQHLTRTHHVLQLLLLRTSRQLLWLLACALVGAGYALLWQVPGHSYDEATVAQRAFVGIGLTTGGALLGALLGVTRR
jgi:hypothetical protein